jgi:co-chaperonin GroES (HSP10)
MLGTLPEEKKSDWKSYVPQLVHAYNATRHDTSGVSPYFLMFARHPRLPVDVAFGLDLNTKFKSEYGIKLTERLNYAYEVARAETVKQCQRRKKNYDKKVRQARLHVGDRVLVKKFSFIGKHKIADRWEQGVYIVRKQPDEQIPVYVVSSENDGKLRTLHRNMLLPISYLSEELVDTPMKERKRKQCPQDTMVVESASSSSDEEEIVPVGSVDPQLNISADNITDERSDTGDQEIRNLEGESDQSEEVEIEEPVLRRSTRERRPPTRYANGEFIMNSLHSSSTPQSVEYFV